MVAVPNFFDPLFSENFSENVSNRSLLVNDRVIALRLGCRNAAPALCALRYTRRMLEAAVAGVIAVIATVAGYLLERRYGDRLEALEARQAQLELDWYGEE